MSVWNKDLSRYIWSWLEPAMGILLFIDGVKTVVTHEYRYRFWAYHGAVAQFAGVLMVLGAFLFFRGFAWQNRGWDNWTVVDKVVGSIVGLGILFFIILRWIPILM
jgi:hypothetical protein